MTEHQQSRVSYWKAQRTLLKVCASLSTQYGAKVLCVATAPEADMEAEGVKQNIVTIEPRTGNISATKLTGNTIVFNSYPDAGSRPPVTNTKAGTKVGFHVKVTGTVAAVLDSQTVANYHIAEPASTNKRKRETVVKHEDNNHEDVVDLTQLDSLYSEVAKQKERCARLLQADVRFV